MILCELNLRHNRHLWIRRWLKMNWIDFFDEKNFRFFFSLTDDSIFCKNEFRNSRNSYSDGGRTMMSFAYLNMEKADWSNTIFTMTCIKLKLTTFYTIKISARTFLWKLSTLTDRACGENSCGNFNGKLKNFLIKKSVQEVLPPNIWVN